MSNLVLASTSLRRKELFNKLCVPFTAYAPNVEESFDENLLPEEIVTALALRKAKAASRHHPESFVVGSDTIVVHNGNVLGKPNNRETAKQMLEELSGSTHSVYTGVAVIFGKYIEKFYEKTDVTFWELSDREIKRYLDSDEPYDKAGAYGIQGQGGLLVKSINGDYYSVVGLPVSRLARVLERMGFPLFTRK